MPAVTDVTADRRVVIQPQARDDANAISDHLVEEAGYVRTFEYITALTQAMLSLSTFAERAASYPHAQPGVRRLVFRSHAIFYRIGDEEVQILRILHQAQDPARHLGDEPAGT